MILSTFFIVICLTLTSQVLCSFQQVKCCYRLQSWHQLQSCWKWVDHRTCTTSEMNENSHGNCMCRGGYLSIYLKTYMQEICCYKTPHEVCSLSHWASEICDGSCNNEFSGRKVNGKCVCCRKSYVPCDAFSPNGQICRITKNIEYQKTCSFDELKVPCPDGICMYDHACMRKSETHLPICCKNRQITIKPDTSAIRPHFNLPVCPNSNEKATKQCARDKDCEDCSMTCIVTGSEKFGICCRTGQLSPNNTMVNPGPECLKNGACALDGTICVDRSCYKKTEIAGDWTMKSCGSGIGSLSSVFCVRGDCCPEGLSCRGGVCC